MGTYVGKVQMHAPITQDEMEALQKVANTYHCTVSVMYGGGVRISRLGDYDQHPPMVEETIMNMWHGWRIFNSILEGKSNHA